MRRIRWLAPLLFCLLSLGVFASERPEVIAQLQTNEIFLGESTAYQVMVKNVKSPSQPDLSALKQDFDIEFRGDQPMNQTSVMIVNGQMTRNDLYGHAYIYQLTPRRSGTLAIPPAIATIDGVQHASNALQLRVQGIEKQDIALLETLVSRQRVYPTQSFDVTLRILVKPLASGEQHDPLSALRQPPLLHLGWLNLPPGLRSADISQWLTKFVAHTGRGFSIDGVPDLFDDGTRNAVLSLYVGREARRGLDGGNINYFVYELKRTITAEKPGTYSFSGATLKGLFADGMSGGQLTGRNLFAVAEPRSVEVREIPAPRPASFSGGIGAYNVSVQAEPLSLRVGDPLKLFLDFTPLPGSGSLDLISAPDISSVPEVSGAFDVMDKAPVGEMHGESKRFTYGLRPKRAGVGIPALKIGFFNTDTEKFDELATPPVNLQVTQTAMLNAQEVVAAPQRIHAGELHSREQGIFQNATVSQLHNDWVQPWNYALGAGGAGFCYAALGFLVVRRRREASDAALQRRKRAIQQANSTLDEARRALSGGQNAAVIAAARSAITGLIGDMSNLPSAGMTAREAEQALKNARVSDETQALTHSLLDEAEAAAYGAFGSDAAGIVAKAEQLLPRLHRELEKK